MLFAEAVRPTFENLGMEVLGPVGTAGQGMDTVRRERPDLVCVDLGLPDEDGLSLGRRIVEENPETKVVALTALESAGAVKEAVRAGFHGYLSKDTNVKQFESSVKAVIEGEVVVPPRPTRGGLRPGYSDREHATMLAERLTSREREVLALLAGGASSQDMADTLSVSRNTIRTHVHNILAKLQVHTRLEAAAFAARHGLLRPKSP